MTVAAAFAHTDYQEKQQQQAESDAQRAAAWAWYQRSGGGSLNQAAGAGKSEAFTTRCCRQRPLSRFFVEAVQHHARTLSKYSSSNSSLLTCTSTFSAHNRSSRSQFNGYGSEIDVDDGLHAQELLDTFSMDGHKLGDEASGDAQPSLALVAVNPVSGPCWDCGSSLFDTFELVAMSKKLETELQEPHIEAEADLLCNTGQPPQQQLLPLLCDKPYNGGAASLPPSPCDHSLLNSSQDTCDELIAVPDKHTRQAVYDMFCRYGEAAKQMTKRNINHAVSTDLTCGVHHSRKHKHKHGRLHGIAKVFHQMVNMNINSLGGTEHVGAIAMQDHHHHHHLHYSPLRQGKRGTPMCTESRWVGEKLLLDMPVMGDHDVGSHPKQKHVHHHHHHHYHYLFHSDDDFRLQPLDKSLMVTAAGLRTPKLVSPALSSYLESPARSEQYKWAS